MSLAVRITALASEREDRFEEANQLLREGIIDDDDVKTMKEIAEADFVTKRKSLLNEARKEAIVERDNVSTSVQAVAAVASEESSSSSSQPSNASRTDEALLTLAAESFKQLSAATLQDVNRPGRSSSLTLHTQNLSFASPAAKTTSSASRSNIRVQANNLDSPGSSDDGLNQDSSHPDCNPIAASSQDTRTKRSIVSPDIEPSRSVRQKYSTDIYDASSTEFISVKSEHSYINSGKEREERAFITRRDIEDYEKLRAMYSTPGKYWKKVEGKGEHKDWWRYIYVNPHGRKYSLRDKPVLGTDFFLTPQDALHYCAKHFQPLL